MITDAAKAERVGDTVQLADEPGKAVGQRAVEIEDGEGDGQGFARPYLSTLPPASTQSLKPPRL